jgi:RNA polymerase sigma-70 factor (ECF subfamily)
MRAEAAEAAADDRALAARFHEHGDEDAFRALHARHAPALYALLRRLVGPAAEDALQETWLRAARRLGTFRGESALRTWLFGIALNAAREIWRDRGPAEEALADVAGRGSGAESALDLEQAVGALPPGYRAVLLLHDAWGYTHAEVGALIGVDEGTSKSQLAHARAAVRRRLAGGGLARTGER